MNQDFHIKKIPASLTYEVRQKVLRPGRPAGECIFPGDLLETTLHLGLYRQDSLVGVASFMKNNSPHFNTKEQYQLRGMAVLPDYKGLGYGAALLQGGEKFLRRMDPRAFLWFNARDYAIGFYEKYGYQTFGEKFDIPNVCEHIVMFKQLN